jgi:hypothetical protein
MVGAGQSNRNIRFWDIDIDHDKSGLVGIEAATENKGLHTRISALFEAAEAGEIGRGAHSGGGCPTGFPASVFCVEVRIWGTEGGFCGIASFRKDLWEACQILRNLLGPFIFTSQFLLRRDTRCFQP